MLPMNDDSVTVGLPYPGSASPHRRGAQTSGSTGHGL